MDLNYVTIHFQPSVFATPVYFPSLKGGRTRANSVCFAKNLVKIGAFPNATLTSKIWKNLSVDQKDKRRRSVWVGQADSSKIAQRKQKFIIHVNWVFT